MLPTYNQTQNQKAIQVTVEKKKRSSFNNKPGLGQMLTPKQKKITKKISFTQFLARSNSNSNNSSMNIPCTDDNTENKCFGTFTEFPHSIPHMEANDTSLPHIKNTQKQENRTGLKDPVLLEKQLSKKEELAEPEPLSRVCTEPNIHNNVKPIERRRQSHTPRAVPLLDRRQIPARAPKPTKKCACSYLDHPPVEFRIQQQEQRRKSYDGSESSKTITSTSSIERRRRSAPSHGRDQPLSRDNEVLALPTNEKKGLTNLTGVVANLPQNVKRVEAIKGPSPDSKKKEGTQFAPPGFHKVESSDAPPRPSSKKDPEKLSFASYLISPHMLINNERRSRSIPVLSRLTELDEAARFHATGMAKKDGLFYCNNSDVKSYVNKKVKQNVAYGKSTPFVHKLMMENMYERNNILAKKYKYMGVGTSQREEGIVYVCYMFAN